MARKEGVAPSRPWAQGQLAALLAEAPSLPRNRPQEEAARAEISATSHRLRAIVLERRGHELERNRAARELGQLNARKAEMLPRHAKLSLQLEGLRLAQLRAIDLDQQRRFRRERAEMGVQLEDVDAVLQQLDGATRQLRAQVLQLEQQIADNEHRGHATRQELLAKQRAAASLAEHLAPLEHELALATCTFFLAPPGQRLPALLASRQAVADQLLALCEEMAAARFAEAEVAAFAGGRRALLAELTWSLLALGDDARLNALYEAIDPSPASHQIFPVFRALLPVLLRRGRSEALLLAVAAHRFAQGLRGALAEAAFCLVNDDVEGFTAALQAVATQDWRQGHEGTLRSLGLLSMATAGLLRLAEERGWALPTTAPTIVVAAPQDLWRRSPPP